MTREPSGWHTVLQDRRLRRFSDRPSPPHPAGLRQNPGTPMVFAIGSPAVTVEKEEITTKYVSGVYTSERSLDAEEGATS